MQEDIRYFAKINTETTVVERVIIATPEFISDNFDNSELWIETFMDGSQRKNYAGIGFTYDSNLDAFIPPNFLGIGTSRVLDLETCQWVIPVPCPGDESIMAYNDHYCSWYGVAPEYNNPTLITPTPHDFEE